VFGLSRFDPECFDEVRRLAIEIVVALVLIGLNGFAFPNLRWFPPERRG
jgi:hypothetical protein